jgi:[1-hydroxy-2-(trimethylamino)ethyl]phosphonate dioxygenase
MADRDIRVALRIDAGKVERYDVCEKAQELNPTVAEISSTCPGVFIDRGWYPEDQSRPTEGAIAMDIADEVMALFEVGGGAAYFGEPVSQLEHALQCASLAEQAGAENSLVVAALLHDVGHLLHGKGEDIAERGTDAQHEEMGYAWLAKRFGLAVAEPVRLHVAAKRYLCATDTEYSGRLSPASQLSLSLQGGPFTREECGEFESSPYFSAAIRLRRWDDEAKIPALEVSQLEHYRSRILNAANH